MNEFKLNGEGGYGTLLVTDKYAENPPETYAGIRVVQGNSRGPAYEVYDEYMELTDEDWKNLLSSIKSHRR